MSRTILLVSQNPALQSERALLLEQAGYNTMRTGNLTSAIQLAANCQMSLIDQTFGLADQNEFIEHVHECSPSVFILCLRHAPPDSRALLQAVEGCFHTQPGGSRICIFGPSNVISWPRKAS